MDGKHIGAIALCIAVAVLIPGAGLIIAVWLYCQYRLRLAED